MTSETVSDAMSSNNKRVWFKTPTSITTDSPHIKGNKDVDKYPKGYALTLVSTFAVALRQHISPIVQKSVEPYIDLLHKLINKMDHSNKMDDNSNFIPRSPRMVNFNFQVTKKVEKTLSIWLLRPIQTPSC